MRKLTFEDIEKNGLLLYRYTRGSHCQGTATESSDIDEGGVYICPPEQLLGLGLEYQDKVANSTKNIFLGAAADIANDVLFYRTAYILAT